MRVFRATRCVVKGMSSVSKSVSVGHPKLLEDFRLSDRRRSSSGIRGRMAEDSRERIHGRRFSA